VWRSFDGTTWDLLFDPGLDTGTDTNNVCAIAYYCGRVWVFANDAPNGTIAVFREHLGSVCSGLGLQVI
jgi:hypothetical protein